MVALFVETLLLMAAAYFVGAALACLVRRSLFARARPAAPIERRVDPLPEATQRAAGAARFGRGAESEAQPLPTPAASQEPAQDLKRIRLIDAPLESSLNELGVRRYD